MFNNVNIDKQKKLNKKLLLIIGSVAMFVLVVACTFLILFINKPASKSVETISSKNVTLIKLGDFLKQSLKNANNVSSMVYKSTNSSTVINKIENNVWTVSDDGVEVLTFSSIRENINDNKSDYDLLMDIVKSEGFSETKTLDNLNIKYNSINSIAQYFVSDNFVCNLHNEPEAERYLLRIDCVNKTSFDKNTVSYKSLAKVYPIVKKDVVFSKINIQNSHTENYKNASVVASDLKDSTDYLFAMFYQMPNKKWYFFTESKNPDKINCSDYKTDDLIKSFIGFTCWDNTANKSSFVNTKQPTFTNESGAIGG